MLLLGEQEGEGTRAEREAVKLIPPCDTSNAMHAQGEVLNMQYFKHYLFELLM